MIKKKTKWYRILDSEEDLNSLFIGSRSIVHKSLFGEYLLIKSNDEFFATKNKCPHQNKPLEGCEVHEGKIICPFHRYEFDLNTGRGHGMCIEKYEMKIDETGVFIGKEKWSIF